MKNQSDGSERRRHPRRAVIWMGSLRVGEWTFACRVLDLSLTGARIRLALPLKRGAEVTLSVPRCGDIPAEVAWHKDDKLGINFSISAGAVRDRLGEAAAHSLGLDLAMIDG